MPSKVSVKSNLKGWEQLQKNLKTKLVAKVGIFSDDSQRSDGDLTNVQIGARHEFGVISEGLPRRSFLNDPIELKRKELLKKADGIIKANIDKEGGAEKIFELIGIVGEAIVQEAFETGGFGTWQSLSERTINKKESSQILIDSSQLRRAVISKVDKRE
jgi:hypothetical protein